ncbi:MAG: hypothetical protein AB7E95_13025 [Kiritimatiellales bacterium]
MKAACLISLLFAGASTQAAHEWGRYQAIMDRSPFGKEPPLPETPAVSRPAGEFAKQYRLCMLYEDALGQLKAGLVSKTNNKNFFLQVGESEDDLSLVDVQIEEGIAVLQKGSETAQLVLERLDLPAVPESVPQKTEAASISIRPQIVRRAGAPDAPRHVQQALKDSEPKKAVLTLRFRHEPGGASSADSGPSVGLSNAVGSGRLSGAASPATVGTKKTIEKGGGYSIQPVPSYLQKKYLAKGL